MVFSILSKVSHLRFQVGHNFGCQHDKDHGDNKWYEYGYGWYIGKKTASALRMVNL